MDPAIGKLLDNPLQFGVTLSDDLVRSCREHSRLLQLLKRPPGFCSLVLARVTNEDYPVETMQAPKKLVHLLGARQARFVHEIQSPYSIILPLAPCQKALERVGTNSGFLELLRRP